MKTTLRIRLLISALPVLGLAACGADTAPAAPANPDRVAVADTYAERREIAAWAMEHGLSGLSMASATPRRDPAPDLVYRDLLAIAKYAVEHGLSGLSPASLAPVDDDGSN